jgi:hypothetical protein
MKTRQSKNKNNSEMIEEFDNICKDFNSKINKDKDVKLGWVEIIFISSVAFLGFSILIISIISEFLCAKDHPENTKRCDQPGYFQKAFQLYLSYFTFPLTYFPSLSFLYYTPHVFFSFYIPEVIVKRVGLSLYFSPRYLLQETSIFLSNFVYRLGYEMVRFLKLSDLIMDAYEVMYTFWLFLSFPFHLFRGWFDYLQGKALQGYRSLVDWAFPLMEAEKRCEEEEEKDE